MKIIIFFRLLILFLFVAPLLLGITSCVNTKLINPSKDSSHRAEMPYMVVGDRYRGKDISNIIRETANIIKGYIQYFYGHYIPLLFTGD